MMKRNRSLILLFLLVFTADIGLGYYLAHVNHFIYGDAISRVANAFYVIYSRDPHLGAIGFIWNPLPSILEMIPLLFWKIAPMLLSSGLSAVIVSASLSAGTSILIYSRMQKHGIPLTFRIIAIIGFSCNPFVLLYGANGMSEMMFAFCIVWTVFAFTDWISENQAKSLIELGIALSLGFWIRYEAVALGAAVAFCIIIFYLTKWFESYKHFNSRKELYARTEATLLMVLVPPICSGLLWILLNYSIMGDPFFFLHSGYSNSAFVQDRSDELLDMTGNIASVILFSMRKMMFFAIPLIAIIAIRISTSRRFHWDLLMLVALAGSIPALQAVMLYQGTSYGWLRFFVYPFIVAVAWLPYEWKKIQKLRHPKLILSILCLAVLLSSGIIRNLNDDNETLQNTEQNQQIAQQLDKLIESEGSNKTLILTDSFSAFPIIVHIKHPQSFVITNDRDFEDALSAPQEHGIDYILISRVEGSVLHIIHQKYPELFDGGLAWTRLEKDFGDNWRLYRVLPGKAEQGGDAQ